MIIATRVDHRLIHGQVAFSWTSAINADCILVANDAAAKDQIQMTTLKLAAPQGVKVVIKGIEDSIKQINSGITDKYRLFIVLKTVDDAYKLIKGCDVIKSLNIGGTIESADTKQITSVIYLDKKDKKELKELEDDGIEVFAQMVPNDKKIDLLRKL